MEKSIRKIILLLITALFSLSLSAQEASVREQIRIRVWSEMDAYPGGSFEDDSLDIKVEGSSEDEDAVKDDDDLALYRYAINRVRELSPYLVSGMLYGWDFDYVPSDKTRQVSEEFDFNLIKSFDKSVNLLTMHYPIVKDEQLVTWVWCSRTDEQISLYDNWISITNPKIHGTGSASVEKGFEGVQEACGQAIKNAVRSYYQQTVKNKPKEITGKVILSKEPRIYIKNGLYTVDLDFFMETDRIILYTFY